MHCMYKIRFLLTQVQLFASVCGKTRYDTIFEGWANLTTSVASPSVLLVEGQTPSFALSTKKRSIICGHTGFTTDDDDVVIITGRPGELPIHGGTRELSDYNPFLDTTLKFIFIERNVANRTTDLYQTFTRRYCDLNKARLRHLLSLARTNPEEFAWVYMERPGYTAVSRGEVIHPIKCVEVEVQPRHTDTCFNDLPVTYRNGSYFLKPSSRLLVTVGTPVSCSPDTPVLFLIEGAWIKIGGESYIAPEPIKLSPSPKNVWEYGDLKSRTAIGFLSSDQLKEYREAIIGPAEYVAISTIFVNRVRDYGRTSSQGLDFSHSLDANKMVEQVSSSVISQLYGWWDFIARQLGAILGFSIVWNMIVWLFSTCVNGFVLFRTYGWSPMFAAAGWGSLSKHLVYGRERFWRRKQPDQPTAGEPMPEVATYSALSRTIEEMTQDHAEPSTSGTGQPCRILRSHKATAPADYYRNQDFNG